MHINRDGVGPMGLRMPFNPGFPLPVNSAFSLVSLDIRQQSCEGRARNETDVTAGHNDCNVEASPRPRCSL